MSTGKFYQIFMIFLDFVCFYKDQKSDKKHYRKCAHAQIHASGDLAYQGYQHGSHKGCPFAADIVNTEIFPGFVFRDDLGKVGAGQRLDSSLENSYAYGQDPELILFGENDPIKRNTEIGSDTDQDQPGGRSFSGQSSKGQRCGKSHDLGQQKSQKESCGIQAESGSIGGGHIDNGVNPVNKEEKGDQEKEDFLFLFQLRKNPGQTFQT